MKKLYTLCTFILCAFWAAGCSDDDNEPLVETLKVISSEVEYTCWGGSGVIEVEALQPVQATSSQSWCAVSVDGDHIRLTVEENKDLPARTSLIVVKSGGEQARIAITQLGAIVDTDMADHEFPLGGGSVTYHVKSINDIRVESEPAWVTHTLDGESLTFTGTKCPDGSIREGQAVVKCGVSKYTITFSQVNMLGKYRMLYNDGNGKPVEASCVLSETEESGILKLSPAGSIFDVPFKVSYADGVMSISCNQFIGNYNNNTLAVWLTAYCTKGYYNKNDQVTYIAPIKVVDEKINWTFRDSQTWKDFSVDGLFYAGFSPEGKLTGAWSLTDLVLQAE